MRACGTAVQLVVSAVLAGAGTAAAAQTTYNCTLNGRSWQSAQPCDFNSPPRAVITPRSEPRLPPLPGEVRPVDKAPEYLKFESPRCAELSEGVRTGASRGLSRAAQRELQEAYRRQCTDEESRARRSPPGRKESPARRPRARGAGRAAGARPREAEPRAVRRDEAHSPVEAAAPRDHDGRRARRLRALRSDLAGALLSLSGRRLRRRPARTPAAPAPDGRRPRRRRAVPRSRRRCSRARRSSSRVCRPSAGGGKRRPRRSPPSVSGSKAVRVSIGLPARLPSAGTVTGARPPVASRCGSSNSSTGRTMGAYGRPSFSNSAASSAALRPARRSRSIGIMVSRFATRRLLLARRGSALRSAKPKASQNTAHWVSLTTARKICSSPATVKTSYTAQGEIRLGIGSGGTPITAACIMCWATRKTLFSNSALCTCWPLPVFCRAREGGEHADRAEHPAHDVVDAAAGAQRPADRAGHVGQAAHHLHHLVEGGAVVVGARQEALVRDVDQARIELRERGVAEAEPLHRPGLEVLAEDVGAGHQLEHDLPAARVLGVDRDALLVAVEQGEEAGAGADELSGVVAAERLDLDHLGAEVAEDDAAGGSHHHVGELDHPDAGERQVFRFGHPSSLGRSPRARECCAAPPRLVHTFHPAAAGARDERPRRTLQHDHQPRRPGLGRRMAGPPRPRRRLPPGRPVPLGRSGLHPHHRQDPRHRAVPDQSLRPDVRRDHGLEPGQDRHPGQGAAGDAVPDQPGRLRHPQRGARGAPRHPVRDAHPHAQRRRGLGAEARPAADLAVLDLRPRQPRLPRLRRRGPERRGKAAPGRRPRHEHLPHPAQSRPAHRRPDGGGARSRRCTPWRRAAPCSSAPRPRARSATAS